MLNHLMKNTKKGSGFVNIFGEGTSSDPAKLKFNWIMNQFVIKHIHIRDLTYQNSGLNQNKGMIRF